MILEDRIQHLQDLSGLRVVISRLRRGCNLFQFFYRGQPIFSTHTYPKAKAYAMGVRYGSRLTFRKTVV
jgi:hypothetical protein